jgi:hypothetical protein
MQRTKIMTLVGSALAIVSNSIFYVNIALYCFIGGVFWSNNLLNIYVTGINFNAAINDIGILMVSGALVTLDYMLPLDQIASRMARGRKSHKKKVSSFVRDQESSELAVACNFEGGYDDSQGSIFGRQPISSSSAEAEESMLENQAEEAITLERDVLILGREMAVADLGAGE